MSLRHDIMALVIAAALLGCGSEESKFERGIVPGQEEAVPSSVEELDMTEQERRQKNIDEEAREEGEAFEKATEDP